MVDLQEQIAICKKHLLRHLCYKFRLRSSIASSIDGSWTLLVLVNKKSPGDFGACVVECSHTSGGEKVDEMVENVMAEPSTLVEAVLIDEPRFAGETDEWLTNCGTRSCDGNFKAFDKAAGATAS